MAPSSYCAVARPGRRAACLLAAIVLASVAIPATAADIGASRTVGVGVEFGRGPGLSGKLFFRRNQALQVGLSSLGYSYRKHDRVFLSGGAVLHLDYLQTAGMLVASQSVDVPWYVGAGGLVGLGADDQVGVKGAIGLAFQLGRVPIDLFIEWTPTVWFGDRFQLFDGNGGVRVWF